MRPKNLDNLSVNIDHVYCTLYSRVSQIAGVFQKMIFESCTLLYIIPFAKIRGPVEKKMAKS